jgi:CBS domain-containing protein
MSVRDLCRRDVDTVRFDETARDAARRMRERQVGSLVVVDGERPVGIVTDRDLAVRVLAAGLDAETTRASEIMTPSPTTVAEDASIASAVAQMRAGRFRRLPVVGPDGRLCGILALDDVVGNISQELAEIGPLLAREAPHRWRGRQT